MYELHYSTIKNSATLHVRGCSHGHPRTTQVIPLNGNTVAEAMLSLEVRDLQNRGDVVKLSPCSKK